MHMKYSTMLVLGIALAAGHALATVSWQTGSYTPGDWAPADYNILRGIAADNGLNHYVESGKPMTQDTAALTDGIVPTSIDYTKVVGISGGTLSWELPQEHSLMQLRIFTWWGDGGRDGIHISEVAVKCEGFAVFDFTDGCGRGCPPRYGYRC